MVSGPVRLVRRWGASQGTEGTNRRTRQAIEGRSGGNQSRRRRRAHAWSSAIFKVARRRARGSPATATSRSIGTNQNRTQPCRAAVAPEPEWNRVTRTEAIMLCAGDKDDRVPAELLPRAASVPHGDARSRGCDRKPGGARFGWGTLPRLRRRRFCHRFGGAAGILRPCLFYVLGLF